MSNIADYLRSDPRGVITGSLASAGGNAAVTYFLTRNTNAAIYIPPVIAGAITYPAAEIAHGWSDSWSPIIRLGLLSALNGGYGYWVSNGDTTITAMYAVVPSMIFEALNYWRTGEFP